MKFSLLIALTLLIVGCATPSKMNSVQLGMSKAEVIAVMGEPSSASAQGSSEYLNYNLYDTFDDMLGSTPTQYYVRLINGEVESYGTTGDFDSTRPATIRVETDENIKVDENSDLYAELRKLKELHEDGILSDAEYEELKQRAIRAR